MSSFSQSLSFTRAVLSAATFNATVLNPGDLFVDSPIVYVVVQVRDAGGSVVVASQTVTAALTAAGLTTTSSCATTTNGLCVVALTAPTAWFANSSAVVSVGLGTVTTATLPSAVFLRAPPAPVSLTGSNYIVMDLPSRSLFPGNAFSVSISGQAGYAVSTFTLELNTSTALIITSVTAASGWQATVLRNSDQWWTIVASLADPTSAPTGPVSTVTSLCTVAVTVSSSPALDQDATFTCLVRSFSSVIGSVLLRGQVLPAFALVRDRYGASGTGRVFVSSNRLTGIVAFAASEVLNLGSITNASAIQSVTIYPVFNTYTSLAQVTGTPRLSVTFSCSVTSSAFFSANCLTLTFPPAAIAPVLVTIASSGFAVSFTIGVAAPIRPPTIVLSSNTINKISGWLDPATCLERYEMVEVALDVAFPFGTARLPSSHSIVTGQVAVSNSNVATVVVQNGRTLIQGLAAGVCQVVLISGGATIATTTLTVLNTTVPVARLSASVVQSISLVSSSSSLASNAATSSANSSVTSALVRDLSMATVVAFGYLAKPGALPIELVVGTDVTLSALSSAISIAASGTQVVAKASGSGLLLGATWSNTACGAAVVGTLRSIVNLCLS